MRSQATVPRANLWTLSGQPTQAKAAGSQRGALPLRRLPRPQLLSALRRGQAHETRRRLHGAQRSDVRAVLAEGELSAQAFRTSVLRNRQVPDQNKERQERDARDEHDHKPLLSKNYKDAPRNHLADARIAGTTRSRSLRLAAHGRVRGRAGSPRRPVAPRQGFRVKEIGLRREAARRPENVAEIQT